jgi:uncharacterized membrane protein YidH (DUF202 family)
MEILGPAVIVVGIIVVAIGIFMFSKKDKRTRRQKDLDNIAAIRGDK